MEDELQVSHSARQTSLFEWPTPLGIEAMKKKAEEKRLGATDLGEGAGNNWRVLGRRDTR